MAWRVIETAISLVYCGLISLRVMIPVTIINTSELCWLSREKIELLIN